MKSFQEARRIVVKVGSSSLTYETGLINIRQVEQLCRVLADWKNSGRDVILVSSGSIAVGTAKLGLGGRPRTIPEKQAAAAVGQCELMDLYDKHFIEYHHKIAQVLLTRDVVENPQRLYNVRNTFDALLRMGAIPVVNENDTVATEEIEFGDNDTLSAIVASITGADGLIILSDIDGLYAQNPADCPGAPLIRHVPAVTPYIESIAGGAGSDRGTGGMQTKIAAAKIALEAGCLMAIVNGGRLQNLYDLIEGRPAGTLFGGEAQCAT